MFYIYMYWFDRYAVREKKLKFSSDGLKKKNNNFDSMRAPGFTLFAKHRLTISIRISIKQSYNSLEREKINNVRISNEKLSKLDIDGYILITKSSTFRRLD